MDSRGYFFLKALIINHTTEPIRIKKNKIKHQKMVSLKYILSVKILGHPFTIDCYDWCTNDILNSFRPLNKIQPLHEYCYL